MFWGIILKGLEFAVKTLCLYKILQRCGTNSCHSAALYETSLSGSGPESIGRIG